MNSHATTARMTAAAPPPTRKESAMTQARFSIDEKRFNDWLDKVLGRDNDIELLEELDITDDWDPMEPGEQTTVGGLVAEAQRQASTTRAWKRRSPSSSSRSAQAGSTSSSRACAERRRHEHRRSRGAPVGRLLGGRHLARLTRRSPNHGRSEPNNRGHRPADRDPAAAGPVGQPR
jgi:hypothetical protein